MMVFIQPVKQMGLVLIQLDGGDADLLKAEILTPTLDI